jgi:hypothetical protein
MTVDDTSTVNLVSKLQDTTISPSTQVGNLLKQPIGNLNGSPYFDDNGGARHDQPILSAKVINVSGYSSSSGSKAASVANSSKLKPDLNDSFEMIE